MRSIPSEEVFLPEKIDIIDIEGLRVCQIKRQIPARKEIPILKLLIQALEETQLKEFLEELINIPDIITASNNSASETVAVPQEVLNPNNLRIMLTHLPKILSVLPDHIVECFSVLIEMEKPEILERFTLAYMIEVLIPFLLHVFKGWMEQFQMISQKMPMT
jgi:hypothetical protein